MPGYPGYIDPHRPSPNGTHDAHIIIYGYVPSLSLALVAALTFGFSFLIHVFQTAKYKTWWFLVLSFGTAMEIVGYAFRALANLHDPYNIQYFIVQYFFIVVAPVLFSAGIYLILSKILVDEALFKPKTILVTFIIFDVVTTIIQVTGASLIGVKTSNGDDPKTANDILLSGLAVQVASFAFFFVILVSFILSPRRRSGNNILLSVLVVTAILVELRTTYRLIETSQGVFGYLSTHEVYFGTLEFLPIILTVVIFNIFHPGRLLEGQLTKLETSNV